MGWATADAPTRSELAACIQCGLCLPTCPTFRLTGMESASPRGRLLMMSAVAEGHAEVNDVFDDLMGFCLQCRACEVVCPSLVPFGRAMEGARIEIAAQLASPVRRFRRFITGRWIGTPWFMRVVTRITRLVQRSVPARFLPPQVRTSIGGLRRLPKRPASSIGSSFTPLGPTGGGVAAVLAGCVMDPWFGDVHAATVEVLRRSGYRVVVPDGQTCCGALAAHDGDAQGTRRLAKRNLAAFASADLIVTDAAGCGAHLKEYGNWVGDAGGRLASKVKDVTEVVAAAIADGRLPRLEVPRGKVAMQDPCHLRHAQRIVAEPRAVVAAAGYEPVEIDEAGMCCGAAGIYSVLHPKASRELGRKKADQVRASGSTLVASANPGCEMQLRGHLGGAYRVAHPVELYWEALQAADPTR
ncbi:MAG TPA: (Fe-S)-binding protein [Acidimicrobiia bacterium]|nr:(Fe-S)-binding protein [Acidimicrobiia bacterium]